MKTRKLLFRLSGCPYCLKAEMALDNAKIEYQKIEIDQNDRRLIELLSGQRTVPILVEVIGSNSQDDEIIEYVKSIKK